MNLNTISLPTKARPINKAPNKRKGGKEGKEREREREREDPKSEAANFRNSLQK
jgi:hypothetical protein